MIELNDVRKVFPAQRRAGEVVAVDGVSLRVEAGEFAGVVGPSGSGKSTLVRLVNLLERPTSGSVTVDGRVLTELPDDQVREARRSIGMVFQHFELLDSRTAAGNVEHPLGPSRQTKCSWRMSRERSCTAIIGPCRVTKTLLTRSAWTLVLSSAVSSSMAPARAPAGRTAG